MNAEQSSASPSALPWILRTGVAMCFIGHGAFGLITKQAWVPYFGVVGLPEPWAWKLMPWVGSMDIAIGFLAFIWPSRALFAWAAFWAVWTALLRPFSGQGWPEFVERAGNYGVPITILVIVGWRGPWFARLPEQWPEMSDAVRQRVIHLLQLFLAMLLLGHSACALVLHKPGLAHHYAVFGLADPVAVMGLVGVFELLLGCLVVAMRRPSVMLFACAWKLGTECLFLTSGAPAPMFEVIERGGSYVVPLALAYLLVRPLSSASPRHLQPA